MTGFATALRYGAVGAGAGSVIGVSTALLAEPRAGDSIAHLKAAHKMTAGVAVAGTTGFYAMMVARSGSHANTLGAHRLFGAGAAIAATSFSAALTGAVALGARSNSLDHGLNALEDSEYRHRFLRDVGTGAAVGAALVGLFMGGVKLGFTKDPGAAARTAGLGLGIGGVAGAGFESFRRSGGQDIAYRPAVDDVDGVARVLYEHRDRSDPSITFSARADASGNGDGMTTLSEVRDAVAAFDLDHDGHVRYGDEWSAVRRFVLAGT